MKIVRMAACGAAVVFAVTGTARAQAVIDMSRVTCEQILTASPNAIDAVIWFSGYYNGLRRNTKLDLNSFKRNAEIVVEECRSNPKRTLTETVSALMSSNKKK